MWTTFPRGKTRRIFGSTAARGGPGGTTALPDRLSSGSRSRPAADIRRAWADAGDSRLEDRLNAVLAGIVPVADAKRTEQAAVERRQREWHEAEQRRAEAEVRRRQEAERLARLESEAVAWSKSQRLRAYIDAVEREAISRGVAVQPGSARTGSLT